MASLSSSITSGSVSSLLKSAASLADAQSAYQDSIKAYEYSNSAFTDQALLDYTTYLQGRIQSLQGVGSISSASKALTLTRAMDSAGKSNISASIARENTQVIAGNATLQDKYDLVSAQYVRAVGNGDMTLAQSLMGQAYSIHQSIQLQAQQSADAATTLNKASLTGKVNAQGDIITDLNKGLEVLNTLATDKSQTEFTKVAQQYVKDNHEKFATLGVNFTKNGTPDTSPGYADIVVGMMSAKYNAMVLKAQAENAIDPEKASQMASDAALFAKNGTQVTLYGRVTLQQAQEAAQSPNMYVYNNATGTYDKSKASGVQYQKFTTYDVQGGKVTPREYTSAVPVYSGYASATQNSKVYVITPNQTTMVNKLGLQIEARLNSDGTVGTGIKAQASAGGNGVSATPDWLTKIIGKGAEIQLFNQNGQLTFASGNKIYDLSQDGKGLFGLTEHSPDGTSKIVGGSYGYNPTPASKGGNGLKGGQDSITSLNNRMNSDFAGVNEIIAQAQQLRAQNLKQEALAASNARAAAAMLNLPPPTLPNITMAPTPNQQVTQAPAPALPSIGWKAPSSSVSQAPAVASPAKAPAGPSGINLQGGGGIKLQ